MEDRSSNISNVSIGMGGSLIITIFVVLCLTVFSVLSFTTAYSDLKLAKKTEQYTQDYYEIHGKAEEKTAEIYDELISLNESKTLDISSTEAFFSNAVEIVNKIDGVSIDNISKDTLTIYYETSGDNNQKLCVTLNILYDKNTNIPHYDILTWNLEPIELPVYEEENFDLWEGFEDEN